MSFRLPLDIDADDLPLPDDAHIERHDRTLRFRTDDADA